MGDIKFPVPISARSSANEAPLEDDVFNAIAHAAVTVGYYMSITNDDNAAAISFSLNDAGNDNISLLAGETREFSDMPIRSIWLNNSSGTTVSYRIVIAGE